MRFTGFARPRELRLVGLLAVALCATACSTSASAASTPIGGYAALGDSYTSGPLIPNLSSLGCLRSDHNYPSLVVAAIHPASFRDASCGGATLRNMTSPQHVLPFENRPQFESVTTVDDVVTLQITANDTQVVGAILTCSTVAVVIAAGTPCRDHFATGGEDQLSGRIATTAPQLAAVIQGIHARAPHARTLLLGYPDILPQTDSGCSPNIALSPGDVSYLRAKEIELNAMIAAQAAANDAEYVDLYSRSVGHDACQPAGTRWVEGLTPGSSAFAVHPNELEMLDAAAAVESTLAHPKPLAPPACPARRVKLSLHLRAAEHLARAVLYLDEVRVETLRGLHRRIVAWLGAGDRGYVQVRVSVRALGARGTRRYQRRGVLSRCAPGTSAPPGA